MVLCVVKSRWKKNETEFTGCISVGTGAARGGEEVIPLPPASQHQGHVELIRHTARGLPGHLLQWRISLSHMLSQVDVWSERSCKMHSSAFDNHDVRTTMIEYSHRRRLA